MNRERIAVIGAGSWGTALAVHLSRMGHHVSLWAHRPEHAERMTSERENAEYLPGTPLPPSLRVTNDAAAMLPQSDLILCAVPSHTMRETLLRFVSFFPADVPVVSATKGIEKETCLLMSEVILDVLGPRLRPDVAALSGPSFAAEVVRGDPTAAVIASSREDVSVRLQGALSGLNLRLYTNTDLTGVQIGGAVKNVIAISAGIVNGLGLGTNSSAALITRGLAEVRRLCVAAGGNAETLSGLAGLGDLVLTCTGALSRNRSLGVELGKGRKLAEILEGMRSVAEGVKTTVSTLDLARRLGVEMPITEQMNEVMYEGKSPLEAIRDLMERGLKSES